MWVERLKAQCRAKGLATVSAQLGYSKTTLSLVLSGKYGADTKRIEEAVLATFGEIECPFEGQPLSLLACETWCLRDAPMSSSWALNHWGACQGCPNNAHRKE